MYKISFFTFKSIANSVPTLILLSFMLLSGCKKEFLKILSCPAGFTPVNEQKTIAKICFGSCANQNIHLPLLSTAVQQNPDLFLFLGDNIYGDTENMKLLAEKYNLLCEKDEFQALQACCPILAVWDDHDYGINDGGREYKKKAESKEIFMQFWGETDNLKRGSHEGIYDSRIFGAGEQALQILLLDLRTFRSAMNYQPNYDPNATMLGETQWQWLETELLKPAKIRIIVSSTQFGSEYHGFESWTNFPLEQARMFDLIASTHASGVFFVSGDMHYGELSRREPGNTYPIYDFTSSGLTETYPPVANQFRVGNPVEENHVGMIDIDWRGDSTEIKFSLIDQTGMRPFEETIFLTELQF